MSAADLLCGAAGSDRKTAQLCRQIAQTLQMVLSGECGDDVLRDLTVVDVAPFPHAGQLRVTLAADLCESAPTAEAVTERLQQALGWLRSAVAASITRRKCPQLLFHYIPRLPTT